MEWQEIIIHTTHDHIEIISNLLLEEGANGIVVIDSADLIKQENDPFGERYKLDRNDFPPLGIYIKTYFISDKQFTGIFQRINKRLNNLSHKQLILLGEGISAKKVYDEDWENNWKQYFKPTQITDLFIIVPKWETLQNEQTGLLPIYIDPGLAFGTGTHPTTILSIQGLQKTIQKDDIVLDVGSGSGILSIASVLLGARKVYAFDLDDIAVKSTNANRDLNNLQNQVIVQQNDLLKGISQQANVIVSNILADVLVDVIDDAWRNLKIGGYFITSGIIKEKQEMLQTKIEEYSFKMIEINQQDNWVSFTAQKV